MNSRIEPSLEEAVSALANNPNFNAVLLEIRLLREQAISDLGEAAEPSTVMSFSGEVRAYSSLLATLSAQVDATS